MQEAWRAREEDGARGLILAIRGNPSFNPGWSIEQCVEDLLARAETVMKDRRWVNVDAEQWLLDLDYLRRRKIAEWRP